MQLKFKGRGTIYLHMNRICVVREDRLIKENAGYQRLWKESKEDVEKL